MAAGTARTGQNRSEKVARRRQSPPNAMAAAIPATTPLTSMCIAHEWLAPQAFSELSKGLVVDRRQIADLQSLGSVPLQQLLDPPNDAWIEPDNLVLF